MVIKSGKLHLELNHASSGKSIAMAIIKRDEFEMGRELLVQVRKRQLKAKIVKKNQIEK